MSTEIAELCRTILEKTLKGALQPIGRYGKPEEVAELLLWLASAENSLLLGQIIFIDGGIEATIRGDAVW